jgi:simple sugar transport system permease protein
MNEEAMMNRFFLRLKERPEFGSFIGFLVFFIIFSIFGKEFFTVSNLTAILTIAAELGVISLGVTFLIISGEFDLSVGSLYAFAGIFFMAFTKRLPSVFAFLLVLAIANLIGFINGVITTKQRIPSFITTLSMMLFLRGVIYMVTGGRITAHKGDLVISKLLSLKLGGVLSDFRPSHFWYVALVLLFTVLLYHTPYGNHVFATGVNRHAARLLGLNTDKIKTTNFMLCSTMAALSGIIAVSRYQMASPTLGIGTELEAIAAVVIGGTSLYGGSGTVIGSFFGVFLISMIRSGLLLLGAPPYWYSGFVGIILLIATLINVKLRPR